MNCDYGNPDTDEYNHLFISFYVLDHFHHQPSLARLSFLTWLGIRSVDAYTRSRFKQKF